MRNSVPDEATCAICGRHFDPSGTRGWCPNPSCGEWRHPSFPIEEDSGASPEPTPEEPSGGSTRPTKDCPHCGEEVRADARFCKHCVSPIEDDDEAEEQTEPDESDEASDSLISECPDCGADLSQIPEDRLSSCPICMFDLSPVVAADADDDQPEETADDQSAPEDAVAADGDDLATDAEGGLDGDLSGGSTGRPSPPDATPVDETAASTGQSEPDHIEAGEETHQPAEASPEQAPPADNSLPPDGQPAEGVGHQEVSESSGHAVPGGEDHSDEPDDSATNDQWEEQQPAGDPNDHGQNQESGHESHPDQQPGTEQPGRQPTQSANQGTGEQPPTQEPGQQPPTQDHGQQPPAQDHDQQPPAQDHGQQPPAQDHGQQPSTQQSGHQPSAHQTTPAPGQDAPGQHPPAEPSAPTECPNCGEDLTPIPPDMRTVCPGCRVDLDEGQEISAAAEAAEEPSVDVTTPIDSLDDIAAGYLQRLTDAGIETIGELVRQDPDDLAAKTGISARRIRGWIEDAPVSPEDVEDLPEPVPTSDTDDIADTVIQPSGPGDLFLDVEGTDLSIEDGDAVGKNVRSAMVEAGAPEEDAVYVHRKHVRFDVKNNAWVLTRLGQNSLAVNEQDVEKGEQVQITDGDEIVFSDVVTATVTIR